MKRVAQIVAGVIATALLTPLPAQAEILAMLNYESSPEKSLRALRLPTGPKNRREGIAIMDVDPKSKNFGKIVKDYPLPSDLVAHHIFYNKDSSKAFVTALGKPEIRIIDMKTNPFVIKTVSVPGCLVGEDVVFSDDNKTWYLTCMGSGAVIVGDVATGKPIRTIKTPMPYPHGIAIHAGIDRMLITNTVRASDLKDPGETITELQLSTGKVLRSYKLSNKKSPSGVAPVEILFAPGSNPPVALITNMFGATLWSATWNPGSKRFDVAQAYDFSKAKAGVPLEIYFNMKAKRLYVTTAKPGKFLIFDISAGAAKPKLIKSLPAGDGAHHVGFTKDWRYAFVQNSFLNLPGMSDGTITVIDLANQKVISTIDTFVKKGLNPNLIVLLPKWNEPAGH